MEILVISDQFLSKSMKWKFCIFSERNLNNLNQLKVKIMKWDFGNIGSISIEKHEMEILELFNWVLDINPVANNWPFILCILWHLMAFNGI